MRAFLSKMCVGLALVFTMIFFGNLNIYADETLSDQNCSQFNATNYQHVLARRALMQRISCDTFFYTAGAYEDLGTNSGLEVTTLYTTDGGQSYHVGSCPKHTGFEQFDAHLVEGDPDLCKFDVTAAGPELTMIFDTALVETRSESTEASLGCIIEVDFTMQRSHDDIYYASLGSFIDGGAVVTHDGTATIDAYIDINGHRAHEFVQTWNSPSNEAKWIHDKDASLEPVFPKSDQCAGDLQPLSGTITIRFDLSSHSGDNILGIDTIGFRFNEDLCDGAPLSHNTQTQQ